jgi:hypothetical protein
MGGRFGSWINPGLGADACPSRFSLVGSLGVRTRDNGPRLAGWIVDALAGHVAGAHGDR